VAASSEAWGWFSPTIPKAFSFEAATLLGNPQTYLLSCIIPPWSNLNPICDSDKEISTGFSELNEVRISLFI
jgi:hypothetical protein